MSVSYVGIENVSKIYKTNDEVFNILRDANNTTFINGFIFTNASIYCNSEIELNELICFYVLMGGGIERIDCLDDYNQMIDRMVLFKECTKLLGEL